jgi:hypothetical protein
MILTWIAVIIKITSIYDGSKDDFQNMFIVKGFKNLKLNNSLITLCKTHLPPPSKDNKKW